MNLLDTMNGLGHYAKKAFNAVKKPLALTLAGTTMISMIAINEVQGQMEVDTIYATGGFVAKNSENNGSVSNVLLSLRPEEMAMVVPDTTYEFITNGNGIAFFEDPGLPVYIDSTTGILDFLKDNTQILPNFGSDINVFLPQDARGVLQYITVNGQITKEKDFSGDQVHMDLSDMAPGLGLYRVLLEDGTAISGKYVKMNVPSKGPSSRPLFTPSSTKSGNVFNPYEATYWIKWEKEGFATDSTLITLHDGENDPIFVYMQPVGGIPQHQDLVGTAKKSKDEGYGPLANITAILYNQTTNQTTQITTGSDGKFVFEDVPAGSICWISVGGNDSRYSFNDIYYEIANEIQNMNDTIADIFSTVHDNKLATTTANRIVQTSGHGVMTQERKVWYDPNMPNSEVNTYEGYFDQLEGMSDSYTYTQVTDENEAHIKIYDGTPNTGTNGTNFITPLKTYTPVTVATVTLNTAINFGGFCHEIYQANSKNQTNFGILGPNPPETGPTQEDLDIDRLDMQYWVYGVYTDQETNVDLNLISEDLDNKSPQYKGNLGAGFSIGKK